MNSTVIELSRYSADNVQPNTNGAWTSKLVKPVTLEQGDVCMLKQAFIDCTVIDNESIFIEQDVSLTFEFIYWMQNHGINMYEVSKPAGELVFTPAEPDGLPYMLVNNQPDSYPYKLNLQNRPVINSKTINIKKGIYNMVSLAENMSRQFEEVRQPPNASIASYNFSKGYVLPIFNGDGSLRYFTAPELPPPKTTNNDVNIISTFSIPLYFGVYSGTGAEPPPEYYYSLFYIDAENNFTPCSYYQMTDINKYNYNGANLVTRYGSSEDTIGATEWNGSGYILYDAGLIGATEIAIEFNQTGDNVGKFSFTYAHSPLLNNNSEVIGTYNELTSADPLLNYNMFLNAYSGIMFLNIYQNNDIFNFAPLMNQLGFLESDLIPKGNINLVFSENNLFTETATNIIYFSYYNTFLPYTTRNFFPIQGIISSSTTNINGQGGTSYKMNNYSLAWNLFTSGKFYTFTDSTSTDPLRATNYPLSSKFESGHYLIQLSGYGSNNEFINNEKLLMIKGIVGNYMYSTNSFAMTLGPDSYMYVHNSPIALTLTSIDVAILNPVLRTPDPNLGLNSCIYLQITKEGNPPPIEGQPTKKEETPK